MESSPAIDTRPARADDVVFCTRVHHEAYHDVVVRQFGRWDAPSQDEFFLGDWRNGTFEILQHHGHDCGYVCVEWRENDVHVREIVIAPQFQNQGVGTAFITGIVHAAADEGLPVRLGTFRESRALSFYKRLGFREIGRTDTHVLLEYSAPVL